MNNKRNIRARSKERLSNSEYHSNYVFRELKAKKSKYGFTSLMYTPDQIIAVGNGLEEVKQIDPLMTDTVVQYNRHRFDRNRVYIYTNNDTLADNLRIKEKPFKKPEWKHYLQQIAKE